MTDDFSDMDLWDFWAERPGMDEPYTPAPEAATELKTMRFTTDDPEHGIYLARYAKEQP